MEGIIKLKNPIEVNGKTLTELKYNTDKITGALFCEADAKRRIAAGVKNVALAPAAEFDYSLHLYMGYAACIAANGELDFADMERAHGADVIEIMSVGRNFMLQSEDLQQSNSDEQSEITAEHSTQA